MLNDNSKKSRFLINILGVPLMIFSFYTGGIFFAILISTAMHFCIQELNNMFEMKGLKIYKSIFYIFLLVYLLSMNLISESISVLISQLLFFNYYELNVFFYSIILFFIYELMYNGQKFNFKNYLVNILSVNWLFFGLLSIIKIRLFGNSMWNFFELNLGFYFTVLMFLSIWSCDSFAYIFGSKFGKKKIFPLVSPKKTWFGAIAGYLMTLLFLFVIYNFYYLPSINYDSPRFTILDVFIISFIFGVISQLGDYIESYIKRSFNVKDSGTILQGHGGMLDRLDSLLLVAPFFVLYLFYYKAYQF